MSNQKKTVVIVGASDKPHRASHQLLERLKSRGVYEVVLVHPQRTKIDGLPVLPSLSDVAPSPDIVTLYVNAGISRGMETELERLRPRRVIFNPGAENPELFDRLGRQGIEVEEACSLVLLSQNAL